MTNELVYRLRMNESDKTKASMQRDCGAAADEIGRLQPYEDQTRHLERRIRDLTEQLNCLKLDRHSDEPCEQHVHEWIEQPSGMTSPTGSKFDLCRTCGATRSPAELPAERMEGAPRGAGSGEAVE